MGKSIDFKEKEQKRKTITRLLAGFGYKPNSLVTIRIPTLIDVLAYDERRIRVRHLVYNVCAVSGLSNLDELIDTLCYVLPKPEKQAATLEKLGVLDYVNGHDFDPSHFSHGVYRSAFPVMSLLQGLFEVWTKATSDPNSDTVRRIEEHARRIEQLAKKLKEEANKK